MDELKVERVESFEPAEASKTPERYEVPIEQPEFVGMQTDQEETQMALSKMIEII